MTAGCAIGRMNAAGLASARRVVFLLALEFVAGVSGCERPPLCPEAFATTEVTVPATNVVLPTMFAPINASTTSAPDGVAINIASNQGTVIIDDRGPLQAFIYERESFVAADSTLYAGLAIADGAWVPFWLYCSGDGHLTTVAGEMTDRDLGLLYPVDGICSDQNVAPMAPVVIPSHTLRSVALTCGFNVTASAPTQLDVSGGRPGTMAFGGDSATVFPFHTVDCRTGCGSPGWYEVHSVVWDQTQQLVSFGIFYLAATGVTAGNGLTMPTGNSFQGFQFPGATSNITR